MPKRTILRPDERRLQLLDAATWVFARLGYRHAGVSDIIARAGVARGTFYLYFESKHQIFLAVVSAFHDRVAETLDGMDAQTVAQMNDESRGRIEWTGEVGGQRARAAMAASFEAWLGFFAAHRDAAAVVLREASSIDPRFEQAFLELRQSALDAFAARLRRLQALGLVNQDFSAEFVARLQLGMLDELTNTFVLRETDADIRAVADQLAAFAWDGLSRKPEP